MIASNDASQPAFDATPIASVSQRAMIMTSRDARPHLAQAWAADTRARLAGNQYRAREIRSLFRASGFPDPCTDFPDNFSEFPVFDALFARHRATVRQVKSLKKWTQSRVKTPWQELRNGFLWNASTSRPAARCRLCRLLALVAVSTARRRGRSRSCGPRRARGARRSRKAD